MIDYKVFENLREFKMVYMIVNLEGKGTLESPYREVRYFFEKPGECIGRIDPTQSNGGNTKE